jgi:hypothetical protein
LAVFPFLFLFILKTGEETLRNLVFVKLLLPLLLLLVVVVAAAAVNAVLALTVAAGAGDVKGKVKLLVSTP